MSATSPDAGSPRIISPKDRPSAATCFRAVFRSFEPYGSPFQPSVSARLLVYADPWQANPWGLNGTDLGALLAVSDDRDFERVFISLADPQDCAPDEGHYVISPLTVESYTRTRPTEAWPIVPHAIYPPSGRVGGSSAPMSRTSWWAARSGSSPTSPPASDELRTR